MLAYAVSTSIFTCNLYAIDLMPDGTTKDTQRQLTRENSEIHWTCPGQPMTDRCVYGSGAIATYALRRVSVTGGTSQVLEMAADHARTPRHFPQHRCTRRVRTCRLRHGHLAVSGQTVRQARSPLSSTLDDRNPQLSPDGTRLVFESRRLGKESQLWIGNADGTKVTQLTEGGRGIQGAPSWSPDGNWIAFDGTVSANRSGIWIVEAHRRAAASALRAWNHSELVARRQMDLLHARWTGLAYSPRRAATRNRSRKTTVPMRWNHPTEEPFITRGETPSSPDRPAAAESRMSWTWRAARWAVALCTDGCQSTAASAI